MEVQAALGSDIVMAFDECAPGDATHEVARVVVRTDGALGARSRTTFRRVAARGRGRGAPGAAPVGQRRQALFGIVQGATHLDLRRESLARTVEIGFDGYAIGGLSASARRSR